MKEVNIRPVSLKDFVGQEEIKKKMALYINVFKKADKVIPHSFFYGGPGLGKTSICGAIAHDAGVKFQVASAKALKTDEDLFDLFLKNGAKLGRGSIIFIDEVQALDEGVQTTLLTILEDSKYDNGDNSYKFPKWTFLFGSTNPGKVSQPLRDRIKNICVLEYYTDEELVTIGKATSKKLKLAVAEDVLLKLASFCFGTPRHMNNFIENLDVYSIGFDIKVFTMDNLQTFLDFQGIDSEGMNSSDRKYVSALYNNVVYDKRVPMGLNALCKKTFLSPDEVEGIIERKLIHKDLIITTGRGRQLSDNGLKYYADHIAKRG